MHDAIDVRSYSKLLLAHYTNSQHVPERDVEELPFVPFVEWVSCHNQMMDFSSRNALRNLRAVYCNSRCPQEYS
jgi:hypothetical protein